MDAAVLPVRILGCFTHLVTATQNRARSERYAHSTVPSLPSASRVNAAAALGSERVTDSVVCFLFEVLVPRSSSVTLVSARDPES